MVSACFCHLCLTSTGDWLYASEIYFAGTLCKENCRNTYKPNPSTLTTIFGKMCTLYCTVTHLGPGGVETLTLVVDSLWQSGEEVPCETLGSSFAACLGILAACREPKLSLGSMPGIYPESRQHAMNLP